MEEINDNDLKQKIEERERELELVKIEEKKQEIANKSKLPNNDTSIMSLIKEQEDTLMQTKEVQELGRKFGEERIKSDLSAEASRIRRKNIETAENEFENETRELRVKHLKAELAKAHANRMKSLDADAKHSQMLEKRKKLVQKYGYLYDNKPENQIDVLDSKNETYKVPKDFSYSSFVNKVRQFGRNISKLDKPILQTIKWVAIIGIGALGLFLLKKSGIL